MPGEVNLWPNLTGGEVIDLLGDLRGGLVPARRAELLERFELDPTKQIRAYSKGNRQKVALVAAFASDVELYLLDEPTSGLDPLMETVFQDVVREVRDRGAHRAAVQPHPVRGRGALRPGHDHPRRPRRGVRHVRRAAAPHPHDGRGRDRAAARRGWPSWPACTTLALEGTGAVQRRPGELNGVLERLVALRRPVADQHSRRRWRSCSCGTTATSSTGRRPSRRS